jgi:hypothetical protein
MKSLLGQRPLRKFVMSALYELSLNLPSSPLKRELAKTSKP